MQRKITYIVLLVLGHAFAMWAHDAKTDLNRINDAYWANKDFSMNVIYRLFPEYTSTQSVEEKTGIVKRKGKFLYASYFGLEIFEGGPMPCVVNHKLKTITIQKVNKSQKPIVPDFDNLLKLCSSVKFDSTSGGRGIYTLQFKHYFYYKVEIEFDLHTFLLNRISYFYSKSSKVEGARKAGKPKMDVLFTSIDLHPSFSKDDFSTGKFFIKKGRKRYVLKPAFKAYKLQIG